MFHIFAPILKKVICLDRQSRTLYVAIVCLTRSSVMVMDTGDINKAWILFGEVPYRT